VLPAGDAVQEWTLANDVVSLRAITLGAIITSLRVPDRHGQTADVVLGHDTLTPYLDNRSYFGAVVGRYANRIAGGRFSLEGREYRLAVNDGPHHLHGGRRGFDQHVWNAVPVAGRDSVGVRFTRTSPAGEEHYPGTLDVAVTYTLTADTLELRYHATTDAPTIVNLTQHTYFNLAGETSTSILDHALLFHADEYTPVDASLIPTGATTPVQGTPFDFRSPAVLRERIQQEDEQLRFAAGFDHNFVLRPQGRRVAVEVYEPSTGRRLEVATTEPGVQLYTGQLLDGRTTGAYGRTFARHAGLCLETQHFPDSPNNPQFPSTLLRPGDSYDSRTRWRFTAR
jgi:aldose 1-epimerase